MPHRRRWRLLAAGLIAAAGSGPPALAQEIPLTPAAVPGGAVPLPGDPGMVAPGPGDLVPQAPPGQTCSCGDRRGLSRWRWHRTRCKRHLQESFLGFLEEFNERPLGSSLYAHGRTQVANATAAKMVFYKYDFVEGTNQLNVRGRDKLAQVTALLPVNFNPVVVERTPTEPGLDQARRLTLLADLANGPFPVPAERVVIGPPIAAGMNGVESAIIYSNRLNQTATGGGTSAVGTGVSGFDASGLSGAAVIP